MNKKASQYSCLRSCSVTYRALQYEQLYLCHFVLDVEVFPHLFLLYLCERKKTASNLKLALVFSPNTQDAKHRTDLDPNKLKGGEDLDSNYVLSSRVRTGRSIRGYSLPPHCSRAERRAVEKIVAEALSTLSGQFNGWLIVDPFMN